MSEAGDSHFGHVLPHWMAIAEHLRLRRMDYPDELTPFMSVDNDEGFAQHYKCQILPLHIAAYYLLPENLTKPIHEHFDNQLQAFFHRYSSSDADFETLCYEFESFRAQESPFEYGRRCWTLSKTSKLFWHAAMAQSTFLGKLGYRLFLTPCNSVASERAFSIQNLIHTKSHNHPKSETTNKLCYIYTNGRILDQFDRLFLLPESIKVKSVHDLMPEEEVALENDILGLDVEHQSVEMDIDEDMDDN